MPFEGFDFSHFWDDTDYAKEQYICDPPSDALIADIEAELGYKLPESYIWLMKQHNGGLPVKTCFAAKEPTSWADNHVAITGIMGIGRDKIYALCGELGSQFMIDEWEYPPIGVAICDCPSAGHDMIFLDYRACGAQGEPKVVHVDQEYDYHITPLADTFEAFIRGLVDEEYFDADEDDNDFSSQQINSQPAEQKSLDQWIEEWYDKDEHQKIVDAILALPPEERTDELLGQLAVAYNNLDEYDKAIELLEAAKAKEEGTFRWQYRMGYACFYLAREQMLDEESLNIERVRDYFLQAKDAFTRVLQLNSPEDYKEDCYDFLDMIQDELAKLDNLQVRGSEKEHTQSVGSFAGFVLLSDVQWDKTQFKQDLRETWGIDAIEDDDTSDETDQKKSDNLVFYNGDMLVAVSLMPGPVPDHEAEKNAANNYMWPQAVEITKAHKAHLLVAVLGQDVPLLERGKLFVKLTATCCKQRNALGVYTSGTVFQPEFYLDFANTMQEDELPIFNWIWFGLYQNERGTSAYTYGMDVFGKDEMEILDTSAQPLALRDFLANIVSYVLEEDVILQDGETIGFSAEQKLPIVRSEGISLPGMTLKIGYDGSLDTENEAQSDSIPLLLEMQNDDYYPPFLVDKLKALLQGLIDWLEDSGERQVEQVQEKLDEMICAMNDLQEEFDAHDSEIETVARDSIATSVDNILLHFGIQIDLEEAVRERDW